MIRRRKKAPEEKEEGKKKKKTFGDSLAVYGLMDSGFMRRARVPAPGAELSLTRRHQYYWAPAQSLDQVFVYPADGNVLAFGSQNKQNREKAYSYSHVSCATEGNQLGGKHSLF